MAGDSGLPANGENSEENEVKNGRGAMNAFLYIGSGIPHLNTTVLASGGAL